MTWVTDLPQKKHVICTSAREFVSEITRRLDNVLFNFTFPAQR